MEKTGATLAWESFAPAWPKFDFQVEFTCHKRYTAHTIKELLHEHLDRMECKVLYLVDNDNRCLPLWSVLTRVAYVENNTPSLKSGGRPSILG